MAEQFEQDLDRDVMLVRMCMAGQQVAAGHRYSLRPDELLQHGRWLNAQPESYIEQVVAKVEQIMDAEA